jgi:cytochrome P450
VANPYPTHDRLRAADPFYDNHWRDPETLDIGREDNPHISSSLGTHFCLGAPLARVELEIAFATLARRFRSIRIVNDEPPRQPSLVFRGVTSLEAEVAV